MLDIGDVNVQGVEPKKEFHQLPIGQYLVRIEDVEKKPTKDGNNQLLAFTYKVYGGPNDGETEEDSLNLWHTSDDAVKFAKIDLVSIQAATNTHSKNAHDFINKFMIYTKKNGIKPETKDKVYKHYAAAPLSMIEAFASVPPIPPKPAPAQQQPAAPATQHQAATGAPATTAAPAVTGQLPSWAAKKA